MINQHMGYRFRPYFCKFIRPFEHQFIKVILPAGIYLHKITGPIFPCMYYETNVYSGPRFPDSELRW